MSLTPPERLRRMNDAPVRSDGDFVLYWMTSARRLRWSHALDRSVARALELGRPLVVLEAVSCDYPWASDRHHQAILDGMAEHERELASSPVCYFPYVEPRPGDGDGLFAALAGSACCVVTDDSPAFGTPKLVAAASRLSPVCVEAVDGCGLLPFRAPGRSFSAAYHFRRYLHKELPKYLADAPAADPLAGVKLERLRGRLEAIEDRWPRATAEQLGDPAFVGSLPIDHSVPSPAWVAGSTTGRARLEAFVEKDLGRYAEARNDPDSGAVSGLSPWLHYGHLSAHEVFRAVTEAEGWSPLRLSDVCDGRRAGWWGMSPDAEAFLDQLVTWRELGFGFAAHVPDHDRYESLPEWARATLETHASDPREHLYSLDQLAAAESHDELWNAAQRQLVGDGIIHNYLRMLWGKKILEWTDHPRVALHVMIELNNRHAIDGRDPNSYSGIFWVLGRFDRGWPERPVFGKVRSMTSRSTRRKVALAEYLSRWGPQPSLALG